jgi:hypothetical protein
VKIQNDIFPRPHEVYNCTTCARAEPEHPAQKLKNSETYKVKCGPQGLFPGLFQSGPRWNDIGCSKFDRKIPIPKKGFMPGIETGKYDSLDRK